jgi:hypothetical protein
MDHLSSEIYSLNKVSAKPGQDQTPQGKVLDRFTVAAD